MTTEQVLKGIGFDGKAHINIHAHGDMDNWHCHHVRIEDRDDHDVDVVADYRDAQQMYWDSLARC